MTNLITPRQIFRPDPLLGWRLTPNKIINVRFRENVVQTTNEEGWRRVPSDHNSGKFVLTFYGCSFVFGTGLSDEETFPSVLQNELPQLTVLNKGIGGHGNVQAYLNFKQDLQNKCVDAAVVGIIADHRYRNVPHPYRMKAFLTADWHELGVERVPCARLLRGGGIQIRYVPIWQPSLMGGGFDDFLPDDLMLDLVSIGVLRSILSLSEKSGVPVLFALLDNIDPEFNALVCEHFPCARDVSTPHDLEHRFLPKNRHPNVYASGLYAQRLLPAISELCQI